MHTVFVHFVALYLFVGTAEFSLDSVLCQ